MKVCIALPLLLVLTVACQARTLDDVRASGVLACGVVAERPGFSLRDKAYQWSGFDVDICRAIAAAIIGDPRKVNFVGLKDDEMVVALQSGEVDLLPRGPQLSLSNDTTQGLIFVTPTFFDDGPRGGIKIYGPVVRQGDGNWLQVVRWTVWSLVCAETLGIDAQKASSANASTLDDGAKFLGAGQSASSLGLGLDKGWPAKVVSAVGNYGEIFERHFGAGTPNARPRGMNRLSSDGGLLISPPFE